MSVFPLSLRVLFQHLTTQSSGPEFQMCWRSLINPFQLQRFLLLPVRIELPSVHFRNERELIVGSGRPAQRNRLLVIAAGVKLPCLLKRNWIKGTVKLVLCKQPLNQPARSCIWSSFLLCNLSFTFFKPCVVRNNLTAKPF